MDHQHIDTQAVQQHYVTHPITPPISAGPVDGKGASPGIQSLVMMGSTPVTQAAGLGQTVSVAEAPAWNPNRIFEQWNSSFGTPPAPPTVSVSPQTRSLSDPSGAAEVPTLQDIQTVHAQLPSGSQPIQQQSYSAAPVQTFVTPAMWQDSVASVYEGGLKRAWDFDSNGDSKRIR